MQIHQVASGSLILSVQNKIRKTMLSFFSVFMDDLKEYPEEVVKEDYKKQKINLKYSKSISRAIKILVFPFVLCLIILDETYMRIRWRIISLCKNFLDFCNQKN